MGTVIFNTEYCKEQLYEELPKYFESYSSEKYDKAVNEFLVRNPLKNDETLKDKMMDFLASVIIGKDDGNNFSKYYTYKKSTSNRNLNECHVKRIKEFFGTAPICLDVEAFQRKLLISSSKFFDANEKSCLAVMVDRWKMNKWWTAKDILDEIEKEREGWGEIKKEDSYGFKIKKIEDCLDKNREGVSNSLELYAREKVDENKCKYRYKVILTNLIKYVNGEKDNKKK